MQTYQTDRIKLYITDDSPCSYLPNKLSKSCFLDPTKTINIQIYDQINKAGFRRSGHYFYKPQCDNCQACEPVRVLVRDFRLSKSQRRTFNKNQYSAIKLIPSTQGETFYPLYERYVNTRHKDGDMYPATHQQYKDFLCSHVTGIDSYFFCCYQNSHLVSVTLVDFMLDGLSAIYTFFDPDLSHLSLGKMAILNLIKWAKEKQLNYVYLGYYVKNCQKMTYKYQYQPQEVFKHGHWQPHLVTLS